MVTDLIDSTIKNDKYVAHSGLMRHSGILCNLSKSSISCTSSFTPWPPVDPYPQTPSYFLIL